MKIIDGKSYAESAEDNFKEITKLNKLKKELFGMVWQWGRAGVITSENAPAFNSLLDELLEAKYGEELWAADERWRSNEKYRDKYMDLITEINLQK